MVTALRFSALLALAAPIGCANEGQAGSAAATSATAGALSATRFDTTIVRKWSVCRDPQPSLTKVCKCLVENASAFMVDASTGVRCEQDPSTPPVGFAKLNVLQVGVGKATGAVLVVRQPAGDYQAVAFLGETHAPFGTEVRLEPRPWPGTARGPQIWIVRHRRHEPDGPECVRRFVMEWVCPMDRRDGSMTCPISVPVETTQSCVRDGDVSTTTATLSYTIDEDGQLATALESGERALVPEQAIGSFSLLATTQ